MRIITTIKCVFENDTTHLREELKGKSLEEIRDFIIKNKAEMEEEICGELVAKEVEVQSVEVEE